CPRCARAPPAEPRRPGDVRGWDPGPRTGEGTGPGTPAPRTRRGGRRRTARTRSRRRTSSRPPGRPDTPPSPVPPTKEPDSMSPVPAEGDRDRDRDPQRILIVDDEPAVREALQRSLAFEGYDTEVAVDGADALEKTAAYRPDLLVLDIQMPRMD